MRRGNYQYPERDGDNEQKAKEKFKNKDIAIDFDKRFESAKKNHGQIRSFSMAKTKKRQIKNSQVSYL